MENRIPHFTPNLVRCPRCHRLPTLNVITMPDVVTGDMVTRYEFVCEDHGHRAMGDDIPMAGRNWNEYVERYTIVFGKVA